MSKALPIDSEILMRLSGELPTPFHLYSEQGIIDNQRDFHSAFSWAPFFCNYFAVKATPNPFLMKILRREGSRFDCSSLAELELSDRVGARGEEVMFSSNDTPAEEFLRARELGAIINLDDLSHLTFLSNCAGLPNLLSFRFNPGPERTGNVIIGDPKEAKFGCTRPQILEGIKQAVELGVSRFGLHTMVVSNELEVKNLVETARMMFQLAGDVNRELGVQVEFVNLGGGVGIPMKPEARPVDIQLFSAGVRDLYREMIAGSELDPLKIFMECGRMITGPYGVLVSKVLHKKDTYKKFLGVDACMADLMRPALYNAYHHISVLGKAGQDHTETYDVTGSLCENNDKFAIDRALPVVERGDVIVLHDTGAHGHSMGFNYNGKTRSAEYLLRTDGTVTMIRRKEVLGDLFATLDFELLAAF